MLQARPTEKWGGAGDTSPSPPNLFREKGPHEAFLFLPFWAASSGYFFFFHFPLHCLNSMSERLSRIMLSIKDGYCRKILRCVQTCRAGANYFRLVRPLLALKCEQARGVWGPAPPGKFFKLGTLRSLLRPCLGQKSC